jgi:ABC-type multidrug transport system ATPase subunit
MSHIQISTEQKEYDIYLQNGEVLTIGKNPNSDFKLVLPNSDLQEDHLQLEFSNNQLLFINLSKDLKILHNENKLTYENPIYLKSGDSIEVPKSKIKIIIPKVLQSDYESNIMPSSYDLSERLLYNDLIKIGRNELNDLIISDSLSSEFHAEIYKKDGKVFLRDLGSSNGTFINGEKIRGENELSNEDVIYIGLNAFTISKKTTDLKPENAITANNISKIFNKKSVGLHTMSLSISRGDFVALMGPSGCGKSTLLKALSGDNPCTDGTVHLFGLELRQHFKLLKKKIGYVPQEDIIHEDLKVYESLYFAAKLRLDSRTPEEKVHLRINEVLKSLNIDDDNVKFKRIKKLSGGQRKRVSIAVELLNRPSILFLDEPTSPLDPETIEEFLSCIQDLCKKGTTVVMVTHKPEDLNYANKVIFLGSHGYHVFEGSKADLLNYFKESEIVKIYSVIRNKNTSKEWYDKWYSQTTLPELKSRSQIKIDRDINPLYQVKWLLKRNKAIKLGNKRVLWIQIIQPIIISLLIILVFKNLLKNNVPTPGVIFMMTIATIWFGVSNSAKEIVGEIAIYKRERLFNLKIGPYITSKILTAGIIGFSQTIILTIIINGGYGKEFQNPISTWLMLWFVYISASVLGLVLSATAKNQESVMTLIPLALLPQNILSGIVAPIGDRLTELLSFITLGRWGTESIARIQDNFGQGPFFKYLITKNLYYENSAHTFDSFNGNILAISTLNFVLLLIIIFILHRKDSI